MIRWCAYCHQFLAEEAPFDLYQISYGVCPVCKPKIQTFSESDQEILEGLVAFYIRLEDRALAVTDSEVSKILEEGRSLGIRPLDLMMGMLQPLLAKIGDLWAANKVTVHTEHRFSALVADLITQVRLSAHREAPPVRPDLILLTAEENYHTLGVQMAEVYFTTQGISTLAVAPGLPTGEIIDLVARHRPRALGFSLAIPTQMKQVLAVAEQLKGLPIAPQHILVGGSAVRLGPCPEQSSGVVMCRDLAEARALLEDNHRP